MNPEAARIRGLPRRLVAPERYQSGEVDLTDALKTPQGTQRLRPIQSQALLEMWACRGLVGPIGVGLGKTLILFLAPIMFGAKRPLMMIPSSCHNQVLRMYAEAKLHWKVPPLDIWTYGMFQRQGGEEELHRRNPDLLICDEAHYLKNPSTGRAGRVIRYMLANPECYLVAVSGTLTTRSVKDYAHICTMALREGSPLPLSHSLVGAWAQVLDPRTEPGVSDVQRFQKTFPTASGKKRQARALFQDHFRSTPGVVASSDSGVKASLRIIRHLEIPWFSKEAYQLTWYEKQRPDGAYFEDVVSEWRALRQLSLGWYYMWEWDGEPDYEWAEARNAWSRAVRYELEYSSRKGYDTPLLVSQALDRGQYTGSLAKAWYTWRDIKFRPGTKTVPVWLERDTLKAALKLIPRQRGHIVWYLSDALVDALEREGVPVVRAGEDPPTDGGYCALSITSHGQGWNLQNYHTNLILEPPANGQTWEQMIGRTLRSGQQRDTVKVHVLQHTDVYKKALSKARSDAKYIEETHGLPQRLCYGDYIDKNDKKGDQ